MKFQPRDEYEKEAFELEPPKFDIGQKVRVERYGGTFEGTVTHIYLRTINWPLWMYQVDHKEIWCDVFNLTSAE